MVHFAILDFAAGTILGDKFEIVRPLGRGGSSRVFEATNIDIGKRLAIKVLPGGGATPVLVQREALGASLSSPHIVDIYDVVADAVHGVVLIVMELLEGASLQAVLDARGSLSEAETVTVLREIMDGIRRAHERGVIHGDLKPDNVFVVDRRGEERVVLLDFGIASLQDSTSQSLTQTVGGTPLWMDPEAIAGKDRTWRADTWNLGLLAYRMLAGRVYWRSESAHGLMLEIYQNHAVPPTERARAHATPVPGWLDAFFAATVTTDVTAARPLSELAVLLPDLPSAHPTRRPPDVRPSAPGDSEPTRSAAVPETRAGRDVDVLGTTAISQAVMPRQAMAQGPPVAGPTQGAALLAALAPSPAHRAPPPAARTLGGSSWLTTPAPTVSRSVPQMPAAYGSPRARSASVEPSRRATTSHDLASVLPENMRSAFSPIGEFIDSLFDGSAPAGGMLRLLNPKLDFAQAYTFFLAGLGAARTTSIQTRTFLAYTMGLEEQLKALEASTLKIVIVLVDTTELGTGVRAGIAAMFRNHRATLVPAFMGDVVGLRGASAREWLKKRWHDHRPLLNPFQPRVLDRTLFYGQTATLHQMVDELNGPSAAYGVYGGPGSGKTSLVRRVQAELVGQADFRWIACGSLPPSGLATEFLRRAAECFGLPFEKVDGVPPDTLTAGIAKALAGGQRVVVVLDEADAVVDPTAVKAPEEDQKFLFELRHQMASVLETAGVSFILIGLRAFLLDRQQIAGHDNPLRPYARPIRVPPFQLDEVAAVCALGQQVDLVFGQDAVQRVHDWSSGNVHVVQMICNQLMETSNNAPGEPVDGKRVDVAAVELIASRRSFERRLMPWLSEVERDVLATVPRMAFKRPIDLVAVLPTLSDEVIGNALDSLVDMGVLARPSGKTRVAGKLLEEWVRAHMRPPEGAGRRRRERSLNAAAVGVIVSAALCGAVWMLWASDQVAVVSGDGCATRLLLPKRISIQEDVPIALYRTCGEPPAQAQSSTTTTIEIRATDDTLALFKSDAGESPEYRRTLPEQGAASEHFILRIEGPSAEAYSLRLSADGHDVPVVLYRDWLGAVTPKVRSVAWALSAIPGLLGLLITFYSDVREAIAKLVGLRKAA